PIVKTGRTSIPDDEGVTRVLGEDGIWAITIHHVQEALNLAIDFTQGNATVDDGSIYGVEGGVKIIGAQGAVAIYTIDGRLIKSTVAEGDGRFIAAPRGIVIVKNGAKTAKAVVK
ncbi:MAG: DUF6383 domain-containing protein, partial [Tannerella sp.]|nr:DUF6383 domain-containing protein [Tannerella sp.]